MGTVLWPRCRFPGRQALPSTRWLLQERPERWSGDIRRVIASGLVAIGVLLALFAGVFRYVDQHFYDEETFLADNAELATNADVRERLFTGFLTEITTLANGDVEAEDTSDVLDSLLQDDPSAEDVVDPVTAERIERDQFIETVLLDVFESADYDATFAAALQGAHAGFIASSELESGELLRNKGEIFFNMRALYGPIYRQLGQNELTVEITQDLPPAEYGVFKVADRDTTMNFLWTLVRQGPGSRGLATVGAILALAGAVFIADRRPSTAIQFGGGMVGVGVVLIVVIYLIRFLVPLLTGGGKSGNAVVAVYAANTSPLVSTMIRLVILGVILAAVGGITKYIWPDDWVYSSVSDDRGVRSIMRRRGAPEPEPAQQPEQQPAAAMVPGYPGYPGYAQPPYPGYPQQWGQPYPGQYPPGYGAGYPAGPYAQPAQPLPQHYTSPGKPTVPVMPVQVGPAPDLVPPAAPPLDSTPGDLPADAAQAVPRVVATADPNNSDSPESGANATVVEMGTPNAGANTAGNTNGDADTDDEWASEKDW